VEDLTLDGIRTAAAAFRDGGMSAGLARHHGDKTAMLFAAWAETWLNETFRAWDITALLPRITCPLLALQGREDQYGTALQIELIAAGVPRAETMLLDACGHTPHRDQGAVLDLMRKFIDRHALSSAPCAGSQDCATMATKPVTDQERDLPSPAPILP
jgi:pimeloyl-ACP methyl ester carboxylesterase